jgi:GrpB-like predicted nucleotidyltransferase (UPF0157 family)
MAPKRPVTIVGYDPRWPDIYEEEKRVVLDTIGERITRMEHIGSTAVPSLGAKNIVDMMAGVGSREVADECQRLLLGVGYDDVTPQPGEVDWFYCLGKNHQIVYFHLHLVLYPSDRWDRQVLFRDILRANPEIAENYCALKRRLAEEMGCDRVAYTEAKTGFIESVLDAHSSRESSKITGL